MESMLRRKRWSGKFHLHCFRAAAMTLLLALAVCGTALSQQILVSGKVTSPSGSPLRGVAVHIPGADVSTLTDPEGEYLLLAPAHALLKFSPVRFCGPRQRVGGP